MVAHENPGRSRCGFQVVPGYRGAVLARIRSGKIDLPFGRINCRITGIGYVVERPDILPIQQATHSIDLIDRFGKLTIGKVAIRQDFLELPAKRSGVVRQLLKYLIPLGDLVCLGSAAENRQFTDCSGQHERVVIRLKRFEDFPAPLIIIAEKNGNFGQSAMSFAGNGVVAATGIYRKNFLGI